MTTTVAWLALLVSAAVAVQLVLALRRIAELERSRTALKWELLGLRAGLGLRRRPTYAAAPGAIRENGSAASARLAGEDRPDGAERTRAGATSGRGGESPAGPDGWDDPGSRRPASPTAWRRRYRTPQQARRRPY